MLINELVGNRQARERLYAELAELEAARADLVAQAHACGLLPSDIEWAAGRSTRH